MLTVDVNHTSTAGAANFFRQKKKRAQPDAVWKVFNKKNGGFLKWWYPQIIHFNRIFHYKPSILGYPYFWKHPNVPDSIQDETGQVAIGLGRAHSESGFGNARQLAQSGENLFAGILESHTHLSWPFRNQKNRENLDSFRETFQFFKTVEVLKCLAQSFKVKKKTDPKN